MSREQELLHALKAIGAGTPAGSLESATLDFKEQGRSIDDTIRELVEASLCFTNAAGGVIAVGISDKLTGEAAFIGSQQPGQALSAQARRQRGGRRRPAFG